MPFKDECGYCSRIFSIRRLRRCVRCGQLFCRDCMIPEVSTGDFTRKFCLRCARKSVSQQDTKGYDGLRRYLRFRSSFTDTVTLPLARFDGIVGGNLPMAAFRSEEWWSNARKSVHASAWLDTGWRVHKVNLSEGYVTFKKTKETKTGDRTRMNVRRTAEKPFTPAPYRAPRIRKTSRTRAARLHARARNIERTRASFARYPGKFKPKPAYEKKLYRPDEKPK